MEAPPSSAPCWSSIVKQQPPVNHSQQPVPAERVFVESCKSTKGIAVAVVDANAIIQGGEALNKCADKFVSVSEVKDEIRDPTSRHRLNFIPFAIDTLEPSPEALKKVINFARATGDLQTLSDVDLKLIALTYTLEAQIHGTDHLRDSPPPIHTVNIKRLPEKDMPGWGSNVPNLKEWEALEHVNDDGSNTNSRILPLKDLNLNIIPAEDQHVKDASSENGGEFDIENQEDEDGNFRKPRRYLPVKKEINIEGKKMVADGVDASQGQFEDNAGEWLPAVSRSTHRRFLRRKARREMHEASSEKDAGENDVENIGSNNVEDAGSAPEQALESVDGTHVVDGESKETNTTEETISGEDLSVILNQMRLEEDSLRAIQEKEQSIACAEAESENFMVEEGISEDSANRPVERDVVEMVNEGIEHLEISSQTSENVDASYVDDNSSEQSWMLRSLSESSVACVTSDFAMQNVLLQMGLRLLAPGGMQIRQLHRWILRCHACYKVTMEVGRMFCPNCGNGGTLRKVAVTVGENGIVLAARRQRISLRGTKFSLPLPQGGRDAITKNPILREDQLPQRLLYPKTKKKNKQGDDIFASDNMFCHHTDKKAPLRPPIRRAVAVFSGKRNPNDNHYARPKH